MKMIQLTIFLCTLTIFLLSPHFTVASDKSYNTPAGVWKTIDDKTGKVRSHIKIWEKKGVFYGKIIKLINPPKENPLCIKCKGNLYNKPVIGMVIIRNLKKDGDEWNGGTILDPESGKKYKVFLKLQNNGYKLKLRGYIGISLLGRTQYWYRLN